MPSRFAKTIYRRFFLPFIFVGLIVIAAGSTFWFVNPVGFRLIIFQPVRELVFFIRELDALNSWDKIERIVIPKTYKVVTITTENRDELNISADLYLPDGEGNAPAILLLHGSSPWGRKAGLIRLVGFHLQKDGWIALAPDARGFGETEDPENINDPEAWSVKEDVRRCVDYLLGLERTNPHRVYVLGHSMGANHALEGALTDSRVKALILIGPSRYLHGIDSHLSLWNRTRFSADRKLSHPVSGEVMKATMLSSDISLLANGPLKKPDHTPILLIDGQLEGENNLNFLKDVAADIAPPLIYRTLNGAGHYCGVVNVMGTDFVYYRPDLFNQFMKILTWFLESDE